MLWYWSAGDPPAPMPRHVQSDMDGLLGRSGTLAVWGTQFSVDGLTMRMWNATLGTIHLSRRNETQETSIVELYIERAAAGRATYSPNLGLTTTSPRDAVRMKLVCPSAMKQLLGGRNPLQLYELFNMQGISGHSYFADAPAEWTPYPGFIEAVMAAESTWVHQDLHAGPCSPSYLATSVEGSMQLLAMTYGP